MVTFCEKQLKKTKIVNQKKEKRKETQEGKIDYTG